ncbi:SOS response-associated peptidase [Methylocystis hirsuta]|uniref:Abasic site processing protein n=2 Tax=Methylocystis hirsuta TaxID=369798 RepID=A0A3M9XKC8_9HYPH|nr:SOS response-associated peptidase [Methylocystis hirsuta]
MCGRFTQHLSWEELQRLADLIGQPCNLAPRYNIAPTTQIEVIRPAAGGNELVPMRWGLVPVWWKDSLSKLPATFNARAETVAEKPMFRSAFKARRCVIPASGFYEWTGTKAGKAPHYFSAPDGRPLAFAGLWERASHPDTRQIIDSAAIIVGPANEWMSRFHDRMPVSLDWRDVGLWMAGGDTGALLHPPAEDALQEWTVSPRVNRSGVGDDDPTLIGEIFPSYDF